MKSLVVNRRSEGFRWEKGDVDISRKGEFGNRFRIGVDGDREKVVMLYEVWCLEKGEKDREWREKVKGLYGKRLVCWCKPESCHGDVLEELCVKWIVEDLDVEESAKIEQLRGLAKHWGIRKEGYPYLE